MLSKSEKNGIVGLRVCPATEKASSRGFVVDILLYQTFHYKVATQKVPRKYGRNKKEEHNQIISDPSIGGSVCDPIHLVEAVL
mmetsp:Transcript_11356/g.26349  ORF Transcript_11356/g.26349 Transcript_11356/m.26349 type:complete len:83 (+) Transcript_11356:935-1183(+)